MTAHYLAGILYNWGEVKGILGQQREQFLRGEAHQSSVLRPVIGESWKRCRTMGINPNMNKAPQVVPLAYLGDYLKEKQELVSAALPLMHLLHSFIEGSGFMITLVDAEGIILRVLGDAEGYALIGEHGFLPGASWTEEAVGTNAIGTCLRLDQPVQVFATEHFCTGWHGYTCSAAPIHDRKGNIIGVLDLTGYDYRVHPHNLGLAIATARAIETQLARTIGPDPGQELSAVISAMASSSAKISSRDPELLQAILEGHPISRAPASRPAPRVFVPGSPPGNTGAKTAARPGSYTFADIIGQDPNFLDAVGLAKRVAATDSTVLLLGESGTGKELFAQAIHNQSHRCKGAFVALNCGAIPRELIASELFGYVEGAFTGAKRGGSPGKFELANAGTLFLDEIGELGLEMQVALLRALQERQITRIGGLWPLPLDIRLIAATSRNLREEVRAGRFRQDLYYRLNVISITLPPLRERPGDILLIAQSKLAHWAEKLGRKELRLSRSVEEVFLNYFWPGNVRELENVLERASVMAPGTVIDLSHLPPELAAWGERGLASRAAARRVGKNMEQIREEAIWTALQKSGGNVSLAARCLGVSRATIYRQLKKWEAEGYCHA